MDWNKSKTDGAIAGEYGGYRNHPSLDALVFLVKSYIIVLFISDDKCGNHVFWIWISLISRRYLWTVCVLISVRSVCYYLDTQFRISFHRDFKAWLSYLSMPPIVIRQVKIGKFSKPLIYFQYISTLFSWFIVRHLHQCNKSFECSCH